MISGDRCRLSNRTPSVNSMALFLFRLSVGLAGAAAPVDHGHYQDYQCQQAEKNVVSLVTIAPAATTRPASIQSQPANRWTSFHNGGLFTVKENRRASLASSVQSNMWEPSSISTRPRMQGV